LGLAAQHSTDEESPLFDNVPHSIRTVIDYNFDLMSKTLLPELQKARARSLALLPLMIVAVLFVYKANTSIKVLNSTWATGTMEGKPNVVAFGQQVAAVSAVQRLENYLLAIWPALVFGILIAAAVRAFVSPLLIVRFLGERSVPSQIRAGLAGAPLMLCSCCVAPVFTTVAETSARLAPAIGLMLASPSLNPAALTLTFMLFEPRIAVVRVLLAIAAVLIVGPVAERAVIGRQSHVVSVSRTREESSQQKAAVLFFRSLRVVAIRTVPVVLIGAFVSMLIVQFVPPVIFQSAGANLVVIVIVATIAVPLALPTFLEIPLALSLLAAGFPSGAAVALLFAGPAVNLPSLSSVARVSGWRAAVTVAVAVWAIAVIGGLIG
jgi:uncharacterized protein